MQKPNYKPGMFCWSELATTDTGAAKKFYGEILGWRFEENPIPGGGTYLMAFTKTGSVAGLYQPDKEDKIPTHWSSYVYVEKVNEAAKKAKTLGATIMAEPFDVMDVGRMATIKDTTGAILSLWEPKRHKGSDANPGDPGAFCWFELVTTNVPKAKDFYKSMFGWTAKTSDMGGMEYTEFQLGGQSIAGLMDITSQKKNVPPHWLPYFVVGDCTQKTTQAKKMGGSIMMGPHEIPEVGTITVMNDPQGAGLGILQPE